MAASQNNIYKEDAALGVVTQKNRKGYFGTLPMHIPVLLQEVVELLAPKAGMRYIDATAGLLGHSIALAQQGAAVLAIDRDPETVKLAQEKYDQLVAQKKFVNGGSIKIVCGNFADLGKLAHTHGFEAVDGILFDLGLSSMQLDAKDRGFSFGSDSTLDMRFNRDDAIPTAADVINRSSWEELYVILAQYAEEELSKPVATALYRARPLITTAQLSAILDQTYERLLSVNRLKLELIGRKARIFQALRIAVNSELTTIGKGLEEAIKLLRPGGKLVVISFHSLEDRIAKNFIKTHLAPLVKKPMTATIAETAANSRARSAKLRAGIRSA